MPELSLHHIDQISRDISEQEISFSHLLEDLIDHVCCDVEYEMKNGMSFTDAYHRVKQKMGSRRLKQIQEETLYAVDTKYRYMKNTMKISGVAGTVLFGFAAMFKIQHWPMAGVLMTLGALVLAFVFLPSALNVLWKETHNRKRLFLVISAFFAGMLLIIGTLFKIQHWPMAGAILTLAVLSGILFFIPALALSRLSDQENKAKRPVYILGATGIVLFAAGMLFKMQHWPLATLFIILGIILLGFIAFSMFTWLTWKEESHISSMFIFLVIGFILIVVPGAMITLNLQHSYQVYSYTNNAQQTALYDYLLGNNSALVGKYHDSLTYVKMEQVHSKTTGMLSVISSIEEKMVQESEGQPGKPAVSASLIIQTNTGQEILYGKLSRPFDQGPARVFLMPGCKARKELNSSMAEYGSYLASITSTEDLLKYKKMFDTETYLPDGNPDKGDMSLMSALHSLENMKNGLLTVESCILNKVARHN
jgi:drug/metabolite transporter (DMT)-like permease